MSIQSLSAMDGQGGGVRGLLEDLPSPRPISELLPVIFQEDEFCRRLMGAFDQVLAPVFVTLDCGDTYLDAQLAPDDLVDWLASWVGVDIDEAWSLRRRRALIKEAVALYRQRGTVAGLTAHVHLFADVAPVIEESGGCDWSTAPNAPLPGSAEPSMSVFLDVEESAGLSQANLVRIVAAARPAHVPFTVEIGPRSERSSGRSSPSDTSRGDVPPPDADELTSSESGERTFTSDPTLTGDDAPSDGSSRAPDLPGPTSTGKETEEGDPRE